MRVGMQVLVLVGLLAGCGVGRTYKRGFEAEARGDVAGAAARYMDVLERKASYDDAREGLRRVASDAWRARLAPAEAAERALQFEAARDHYRALVALEDRLARHGALDFDRGGIDARDKIAKMSQGAAQKAYTQGETSRQAGRFEEALAHYAAAQGFVENYLDTRQKIPMTWLAWGDAEVVAGQFRAAVTRYDGAAKAGAPEGGAKAAEVLMALGRHHLAEQTCHQAVKDFEAVGQRVPGVADAWLVVARPCAEVRVVIAFAGLSRSELARMGNVDVAVRAQTGLIERLPSLVDPRVSVLSPAVLSGPRQRPDGTWAVHRVAAGRVASGELIASSPRAEQRRATAQREVACVEPEALPPCLEPVEVSYQYVTAASDARLSVVLAISESASDRLIATRTFDVSARDEVAFAGEVRDPQTGDPVDAAWRLPTDLVALLGARRDLASSATLWTQATDRLIEDALPWVAPRLVPDEKVVDPASLTIEPLAKIGPPGR